MATGAHVRHVDLPILHVGNQGVRLGAVLSSVRLYSMASLDSLCRAGVSVLLVGSCDYTLGYVKLITLLGQAYRLCPGHDFPVYPLRIFLGPDHTRRPLCGPWDVDIRRRTHHRRSDQCFHRSRLLGSTNTYTVPVTNVEGEEGMPDCHLSTRRLV